MNIPFVSRLRAQRLDRTDLLLSYLFAATNQLLFREPRQPRVTEEWAGVCAALAVEIRRLQTPLWRRVFMRLARAIGWGSACQCPAKTPAVREWVSRVAAAGEQPATFPAHESAQRREPVEVSHA